MNKTMPPLLTDFYKIVHAMAYTPNLEYMWSYWTPRKSRIDDIEKVVCFGLQGVIKEQLIEMFNENFFEVNFSELEKEYRRVISNTLGVGVEEGLQTLRQLHELGYLPIAIHAVEEGEQVNIGVPMFQISNTVKGFGWLVNYLETYISCNIWHPMTSATTAHKYRNLVNHYYDKTVDKANEKAKFACGDFSMRGMTSFDTAIRSSAGHLLSFVPVATIPAITWLEKNYNADIEEEIVGLGTASMEHSVMSSYTIDGEFDSYKRLINEVFPKGSLSIVSDTYDYWKVISEYTRLLKDDILKRDGKILFRGDSGDPVDIICGHDYIEITEEQWEKVKDTRDSYKVVDMNACPFIKGWRGPSYYIVKEKHKVYELFDNCSKLGVDSYCPTFRKSEKTVEEIKGTVELLWEVFGGETNSKGYKVLNPKVRAIYGDSITPERAEAIYERLKNKGFSSENAILGIGSYTYQFVTRDTFGFALKATHAIVNGEERQIFKDPKTDKNTSDGNFKKSHRGLIYVWKDEYGNFYCKDKLTLADLGNPEHKNNQLQLIFKDGNMVKETSLSKIREVLNKNKF